MRPVAEPFRAGLYHQRRPAATPMAAGATRRSGAPAPGRVHLAALRNRHPMRLRGPEPFHEGVLGQGRVGSWPVAAGAKSIAATLSLVATIEGGAHARQPRLLHPTCTPLPGASV